MGSKRVKDEGYVRRRVDTLVKIVIEVTGKYRGALSSMEDVYMYIYVYIYVLTRRRCFVAVGKREKVGEIESLQVNED